jgi:hypothetical protein
MLAAPGPALCEVPTPGDQAPQPAQVWDARPDGRMRSRPLEDLAPLLPRHELAANWVPLRHAPVPSVMAEGLNPAW